MGFYIQYKYNKEITKGEYDRSEQLEGSIKVGSPYEDIKTEVLAGKIMALLARRNILVVEIEAFEIEKKKINYRELDDGIVIKNKKFKFDDGPALEATEQVDDIDPSALLSDPRIQAALKQLNLTPSVKPAAKPSQKERCLRMEIYNPMKTDQIWVKNSERLNNGPLALTPRKKYPIFEEREHPAGVNGGMLYVTTDDEGKKILVSDKLFEIPSSLVDGNGIAVVKEAGPKLMYEGEHAADMPELRR